MYFYKELRQFDPNKKAGSYSLPAIQLIDLKLLVHFSLGILNHLQMAAECRERLVDEGL